MIDSIKFFKIKTIKNLLENTEKVREELFAELVSNATDPTIVKRRLRMIRHVNIYQNQLLKKIEDFDTMDLDDLINFDPSVHFRDITNRSA